MDELKKAAARAAVERIADGSVVGLGTGTTLAYVLQELGAKAQRGDMRITGVATSYQARFLAKEYGIPVCDPMDVNFVDIAIDGADEVDPQGRVIKGAGAAHVTEKLVAALAKRFIVVVDESKLVERLGERCPVPIEAIAPALAFVQKRIREMGGDPVIRTGKGKIGPVISDLGNPILDARFDRIDDPAALSQRLDSIPGLVGHGLFIGMADQAIVARPPEEQPVVEVLEFRRG
ncbi:MAG: ribose-5-phosphate isomerase RpiA [Armatimonadetes bacterium]|nr:ribose-5-phosphate isomerase RpiA [Armatimonadota bacterium]